MGSALQVGSSLDVANMRYHYDTGVSYPSGGDTVVKVCIGLYHTMLEPTLCFCGCHNVFLNHYMRDGQGVLEGCSKLIGLLLVSRVDYCELGFRKLLSCMPDTLCILDMPSCHMSYEVLLEIGALPHLQVNAQLQISFSDRVIYVHSALLSCILLQLTGHSSWNTRRPDSSSHALL